MTARIDIRQRNNEVCEFGVDLSALAAIRNLAGATWLARVKRRPETPDVEFDLTPIGYADGVLTLTVPMSAYATLAGDFEWDLIYVIDGIPRVAAAGSFELVWGVSR